MAFQAGTFTLFLALSSPLHELSELLLQFHMIQHLALMMAESFVSFVIFAVGKCFVEWCNQNDFQP